MREKRVFKSLTVLTAPILLEMPEKSTMSRNIIVTSSNCWVKVEGSSVRRSAISTGKMLSKSSLERWFAAFSLAIMFMSGFSSVKYMSITAMADPKPTIRSSLLNICTRATIPSIMQNE